MVQWVWKVEIQGVRCWDFGGLRELWSQEFWGEEVLGSVLEKEELEGGFRVVRAVEGWPGMLGVWVDLGTELGEV